MNPDLAALLADLNVDTIPPERIPGLITLLASAQAKLSARLLTAIVEQTDTNNNRDGDQLLDRKAMAQKLHTTTDWLKRHANELPFTVRVSEGQLRFSEKLADLWIQARSGAPPGTAIGR